MTKEMTTLPLHRTGKQSWPARPTLATYRQTLRWVWQMAWTTAPRLLVGFLLATLLESLLPAALVLTGRGLINALVAALQSGNSDYAALLPWLVLGATLAISQTLISNLGDYWQQGLQDELDLRIGLAVLTHAAQLDLAFLESNEAQDQVERARRYGSGMVAQTLLKVVTVGSQSVRLSSLVGILLWIEPLVVGWLALLALPYWLFKWWLAGRTYDMRRRRSRKQRQTFYYTNLLTFPQSLPEVKFFDLAPLFIERFRTLSNEFLVADRQLRRLSLLGNTIFATVGALALYTLFGRIAGRVLAGVLTVGDVAIYTGSALQLQGTVQSLVQTTAALNEQILHLVDLQAFLALQPATRPKANREDAERSVCIPTLCVGTRNYAVTLSPCPCQQSLIEFTNVSFGYPNNEQLALTDLSFTLAPGETVALVGENGAGKSTLAMLLAGLYVPTTGVIRVDGVDLRTIDPAVWQAQIGFVFQRFSPYEATVRENIAYGNWPYLSQHPAEVEALAQQAQVDGWVKGLPEGYETLLGRHFAKRDLSVGQWQKLALARGIARTAARLLILDEPSASLDARAEYELFSRFREAASERTTLLISHRFSTISMADRILVLEKGRLVECGSHSVLLGQDGHYATLYRLHQQQMKQ
jgi:ABC-type multidrug transport system fused ATPase/permease subunit